MAHVSFSDAWLLHVLLSDTSLHQLEPRDVMQCRCTLLSLCRRLTSCCVSCVPFELLGSLHFLSAFEMDKMVEAEYDAWVRTRVIICKAHYSERFRRRCDVRRD